MDIAYYTKKNAEIEALHLIKIHCGKDCMKLSQFNQKDTALQNFVRNQ